MILKLNATRETYREFYGRNIEQMPKLIADGRVPMNTAQLMQRMLDVRNSEVDVRISYEDNYFDTGDGVVYHPDGRVKIVLDSQHLREMTIDTPRNGGALIIGQDFYDSLEGEEFKKGNFHEGWMSERAVKAHPIWRVLARDQRLLNDYADYVFVRVKERFGYDVAMGVFLGSASRDTPEMRAWFVSRLKDRSNANGLCALDNDNGRLVGIALEALNAPSKNV